MDSGSGETVSSEQCNHVFDLHTLARSVALTFHEAEKGRKGGIRFIIHSADIVALMRLHVS